MSVRVWMSTALLLAAGVAAGEDDKDAPDVEFLEYLGMWDGDADEWELFEEDTDVRSIEDGIDDLNRENKYDDPAPPGDESTEREDEG